jgi:hypothetical protein
MSELTAADRWIYGVLSADAQLTAKVGNRIYSESAPQTAPLPYVVFSQQASYDLMGVGPLRIWANAIFLIRGIAETTSYGGDLGIIVNRIDAVLHAQSGSNVDGVVVAAVRERPFRLAEMSNGRNFRHEGGQYRMWVQKG